MIDYDWVAELGGQGYSDVVKKIDSFCDSKGIIPSSLYELNAFSVLTDLDLIVFENRGKLERKINKIQDSKLLFIKTHNKKDDFGDFSDDNQLIYTSLRDKLGNCLYKNDIELGLFAIKKDVVSREKNHVLCCVGTNDRVLYVRPKEFKQLIKPRCFGPGVVGYNNSGTLIVPFYQLENVLDIKEEILEDCRNQGVRRGNLKKIEKLYDEFNPS